MKYTNIVLCLTFSAPSISVASIRGRGGGVSPNVDEKQFSAERNLQSCSGLSKKKCDDPCRWKKGKCISSVTPPAQPTSSPTKAPSYSPTQFTRTYSYANTGTSKCDGNGSSNYQGPAPLADKSDVAIQFFAFGDTPYDDSCNICNTCLAEDGSKEDDCSRFTCTVSNNNMDTLEIDNTCTYEGNDYICLRDNILPYMNTGTNNGDAAFSAHVGDIIKGKNELGSNRRCTEAAFTSRKDLFGNLANFLLTPGDNDWNECYGYDITSNSDPIRQLWRSHFAEDTSPFHQFGQDFPLVTGGGRPTIQRQSSNPENFYFEYNNVAFIGLNLVAGSNYIENNGVDLNAQWVQQRLLGDSTSCDLKSIVVIGHTRPGSAVNTELSTYFNSCSEIPVLTISGNSHPSTYCMSKNGERLDLTVEAFRSGPILVSVVRDPNGGDYFHIDDADLTNSNTQCPSFA